MFWKMGLIYNDPPYQLRRLRIFLQGIDLMQFQLSSL
jgi:hypothetical protein